MRFAHLIIYITSSVHGTKVPPDINDQCKPMSVCTSVQSDQDVLRINNVGYLILNNYITIYNLIVCIYSAHAQQLSCRIGYCATSYIFMF